MRKRYDCPSVTLHTTPSGTLQYLTRGTSRLGSLSGDEEGCRREHKITAVHNTQQHHNDNTTTTTTQQPLSNHATTQQHHITSHHNTSHHITTQHNTTQQNVSHRNCRSDFYGLLSPSRKRYKNALRGSNTACLDGEDVQKSTGKRTAESHLRRDLICVACGFKEENVHPKMLEQNGGPFSEALWPCLSAFGHTSPCDRQQRCQEVRTARRVLLLFAA